MKKPIRTGTVLLTALCILFSGLGSGMVKAEETGLLALLYQSGVRLLSTETNFTARGSLDLTLDGKHFKHADGVYAQDGFSCYQQIDLKTDRADGSFRKNGYAVVDNDGTGYFVERYGDKTVVQGIGNAPKDHALRETLTSRVLLKLGQGIADVMDHSLSAKTLSDDLQPGKQISASWARDDVPDLLNAGLTLFWQGFLTRYMMVFSNDISVVGYASIEDYFTVTDGIIYSTRELALNSISFKAELDAENRLNSLQGEANLLLVCRDGQIRDLGASFSLSVDSYGSTALISVVPEENQPENLTRVATVPQYGAYGNGEEDPRNITWEDFGMTQVPVPETVLKHRPIVSEDDAVAYAKEIASMDALKLDSEDTLVWYADQLGNERYEVEARLPGEPDPVFSVSFDLSGRVLQIWNHMTNFDLAHPYYTDDMDSAVAISWRTSIGTMLWRFTENLNPGDTMITADELHEMQRTGNGFTGYDSTLVFNGDAYLTFYANLHKDPAEKVKFIVQTSPIMRVVLMDNTIDPMEGGNG